MRARQNLFFEKVPFLENKKSIKKMFFFQDLIIFEYNIGIKEHIFQQKKNYFFIFCPLDFFEVMNL